MRKKGRCRGAVLLVIGILVAACIGGCVACQVWPMVGRCVIADNGSCLLVQGNSPICLSNREKDLSAGLETGDRIVALIRGVIAESYPGQAGAKVVIRMSRGTVEDVSPEVLAELENLGWWTPPEE